MIFTGESTSTSSAPRRHPRRARLLRAAATVTATGSAMILTAVCTAAASAATQSAAVNPSGLAWASGISQTDSTPASLAAFGAWRGHPVDVATVWGNNATWNDLIDPAWLYQRWQGAPEALAIGMPMLPEGVSGVSLQACASGTYNSYWRQFGSNISAYGLGDSMIRLGWEFNGSWYIWSATDPATWVKCWQQIVTSARATAPNLRWDWNVNRGVSRGLTDPTKAYPGNAYVNTIGVDSYDQWPPVNATNGWNKQLNGTQGLSYWLNFAIAHGKKLAIPEWGNMTTGGDPGGDDPAYVNDMLGFFKAHSQNVAWESNSQGSNLGGSGYGPGSTLPKSSAAYQAGF